MTEVEIIEYRPEFAKEFERLNIAWLKKYFVVEPYDSKVLGTPDESIIARNGVILLAQYEEQIVGTVALMYHGEALEVTKMAVDESLQGKGIGKMLMHAALDRARSMRPAKIFLLTSSKLDVANALYEKSGFVNVPLEPGDDEVYARCNRRWELPAELVKLAS